MVTPKYILATNSVLCAHFFYYLSYGSYILLVHLANSKSFKLKEVIESQLTVNEATKTRDKSESTWKKDNQEEHNSC